LLGFVLLSYLIMVQESAEEPLGLHDISAKNQVDTIPGGLLI
jgi:hypothetical protein